MTPRRAMPLDLFLTECRPGGDWETWEAVEGDLFACICLCCGLPGHYQQMLEEHVAANGLIDGVYVGDDGRLRDGHHRVTAARRLGIDTIPLETAAQAQERWVRDHGHVDWRHRTTGDVPDYATLHWCTAALAPAFHREDGT